MIIDSTENRYFSTDSREVCHASSIFLFSFMVEHEAYLYITEHNAPKCSFLKNHKGWQYQMKALTELSFFF